MTTEMLYFFQVTPEDQWNLLAAILCALACAIPGCILLLQRLSLFGDALAHAILPGLAAALLLTGSRSPTVMLIGALIAALLTVLMSRNLESWGRIPEDSALGVTFTTLFALGVVLLSGAAKHVDMDPSCILYGSLEFAAFDRTEVLGVSIPRVLVLLGPALIAAVLFVGLLRKELMLVSFDATLARALGFKPQLIGLLFLSLLSLVIVASFEAVGSILVITMLVAPAATAHLLTDRYNALFILASVQAVLSAIFGYFAAILLNTSVAGMISVISCLALLTCVVLAPRHGMCARVVRRFGILYRIEERASPRGQISPSKLRSILPESPPSPLLWLAVRQLLNQKQIEWAPGKLLRLTNQGRELARHVVRGHRLWEAFLDRFLGLPADHVHSPSHQVEHFLPAPLQSIIAAEVKQTHDPHGSAIPPAPPKKQ
jgi:ABC-type Mn2+/Zn2+ transport system permease subunit/Mn-dependent DtxR family transcriptional regulator